MRHCGTYLYKMDDVELCCLNSCMSCEVGEVPGWRGVPHSFPRGRLSVRETFSTITLSPLASGLPRVAFALRKMTSLS